MKTMKIGDINTFVNGTLLCGNPELTVTGVTSDSRKAGPGDLFIALIGENHDGHDYIDIAIEQGCSAVLMSRQIERLVDAAQQIEVAFILVEDTLLGLQALARSYINLFNLKKIAVTGSTGKTTTKEMLYAIFSEKYKTLRNLGNYNNHIGLPLTILRVSEEHEVGIFEMGMSGLGEIDLMAHILKPDVGVITNIGLSHVEKLGTRENILKAKMEITNYFTEHGLLIVNGDDDFLREIADNTLDYNVVSVGYTSGCDAHILGVKDFGEDGIRFDLEIQDKIETIILRTPGKHNAYNAALAIATGLVYDIDMATAARGLLKLEPAEKRLSVLVAKGLKIIDDTYNASPDSMRAAIDVLASIDGQRKVAILADMLELGDLSESFHLEVGKYAAEQTIDVVIAVGEKAKNIYQGAKEKSQHSKAFYFETKEALMAELDRIIKPGDVILIKGSRGMTMDQIVLKLMDNKQQ
jgi:UDP-N-acetylmuramoyl-tripeptide--D-alanyl-D-alanine ligase